MFDKDIWGNAWSPGSGCPRRAEHGGPGDESACMSRRHRVICGQAGCTHAGPWTDREGNYRRFVLEQKPEHRPPRPAPKTPPVFRPSAWDGRSRVRVGFIGEAFFTAGGTETWHETLVPRLREHGIQPVGYVVVHEPTRSDAFLASHGCPVGRGHDAIRALASSCDVLVAWGNKDLPEHLPDSRPKLISVCHGDGKIEYFTDVLKAHEPIADRFAVVLEVGKTAIPERRRAETVVIPNAVDPSKTIARRDRCEVRRELGIPDGTPLVLWLHRYNWEKDPLVAVAIGKRLEGKAVLILAGHGLDKPHALKEAEGLDHVRVLGPRDDVGDLLGAADVFLGTSRADGFGLSVAEAMAAGVPVVSTPVGLLESRPELAWTFPIGDSEAGTEAILKALSLEHRKTTARRVALAREVAEREWSVERFARQWSELILSLVPQPAPKSKPSPPLPSKLRMASQVAQVPFQVAKHAITHRGQVEASRAVQEQRWSICRACDHFRPEDKRCGMIDGCGCWLSKKIPLAAMSCPMTPPKWGPDASA